MQDKLPKIAISIGDINGIGVEIALQSHKAICKLCQPYYFIHKSLLNQALKRLKLKKPKHFHIESSYLTASFKALLALNLLVSL